MLALHQDYQEMVYQEIISICPNIDAPVTPEDLSQFLYTERFIKETMRLLPTVPLTARQAKSDFYVGEKAVNNKISFKKIGTYEMAWRVNN